ncbi:PhzF family phenazine biosynthesis protein [Actinokineospora auranticolor]|uniref:PhzF family phenazine biosynthesis protein n=1 Tax=Actinokineospora auranticolor TaxID=155976 RepID=A0A2S6GXB0_9PSEU|nr:PhzF family phenazine biosynthesis protein [Actinokineospora auranticolor]PPK69843.1 PhzF family phenazine biosynthesis protein [Actinokineospora auranticolor]
MEILRYTAFTDHPDGGNPAGVVLDATGETDEEMQAAAARVGYSETAFLLPRADGDLDVRYFSPLVEIPFCGHATIAATIAHAAAHGPGPLRLHTRAGLVEVATTEVEPEVFTATLVSVAPRTGELRALDELLAALRWSADDLHPDYPPRAAYAGAWHPVLVTRTRARLADLAYDFAALSELMAREEWTTIQLVHRESDVVFHSRNPFPPGGVVEDPATGASAAALGGYLRELGLVELPAALTIHQGDDMGRPGVITVSIPSDPASGIHITGTAVRL